MHFKTTDPFTVYENNVDIDVSELHAVIRSVDFE